MQIDLTGRSIIITGGSEGIGAGIARVAAKCGAHVGIIARDKAELQHVADEINQDGGRAEWAIADVTHTDEMKAAFQKFLKAYGQIDGVVANAGINGKWAPIDEITPEEWRKTIDINLTGTYLTIHHAVPYLRDGGGGSIVVVSSINGTRTFSNEGASAYASSKAGQLALTKMLALELAKSKIRVNAICPGAIESHIHEKTKREDLDKIEIPVEFPEGDIPLTGGEMGTAEQVGKLACFLLSDFSSHITGTPVWIDGGQSLLI